MPITISVKVEGGDAVLRDLQRAGQRAQPGARDAVKGASFALEKRIKTEMPVDTGRARASWGHWTPADLAKPNEDSSAEDALWQESDGGLTIAQGSNVPYLASLNEGHSTQAPAGFIDKAAEAAQRELIKAIDALLKRLF